MYFHFIKDEWLKDKHVLFEAFIGYHSDNHGSRCIHFRFPIRIVVYHPGDRGEESNVIMLCLDLLF